LPAHNIAKNLGLSDIKTSIRVSLALMLLTRFVFAEDHDEFTIRCIDSSKNKYQIILDIHKKRFSIKEKESTVSEGLIAKINNSKNEINFQLLEINTKDKKKIFRGKNILGELVCDVKNHSEL